MSAEILSRLEQKPHNDTFNEFIDGKWENEVVHFYVRKHWMGFLSYMVIIFAMILFSFITWIVLLLFFGWNSVVMQIFYMANAVYYMFVMALGLTAWINYYFDLLIVTNERLIKIEQRALFDRQMNALSILRIQDVSASVEGVLQTFFNYGSLIVETAGESNINSATGETAKFRFLYIPRPYEISQSILRMHDQMVDKTAQQSNTGVGEGDLRFKLEQLKTEEGDETQEESKATTTQAEPDPGPKSKSHQKSNKETNGISSSEHDKIMGKTKKSKW